MRSNIDLMQTQLIFSAIFVVPLYVIYKLKRNRQKFYYDDLGKTLYYVLH